MKKIGVVTFSALTSIFAIVLLTSAGTAVPYVESNSIYNTQEDQLMRQFIQKIKSLHFENKLENSFQNFHVTNNIIEEIRMIIAAILMIPSALFALMGLFPSMIALFLAFILFISTLPFGGTVDEVEELIQLALIPYVPMIVCSIVIESGGKIGFFEAWDLVLSKFG